MYFKKGYEAGESKSGILRAFVEQIMADAIKLSRTSMHEESEKLEKMNILLSIRMKPEDLKQVAKLITIISFNKPVKAS